MAGDAPLDERAHRYHARRGCWDGDSLLGKLVMGARRFLAHVLGRDERDRRDAVLGQAPDAASLEWRRPLKQFRWVERVRSVAVASPNHNARPQGTVVDTVVLHADAADQASASVSWIRSKESKVSYHALIDRDGTTYRFVETIRRAWHAGKSIYDGRENVNNFSLGLAFANRNDGEPFTDQQYESAALVIMAWMQLFPAITPDRITTHARIREAWRAKYGADSAEPKHDPLGFDVERLKSLL